MSGPAQAVRDARAAKPKRRWAGSGTGWLFVGPLALVFAGFYLWPALQTLLSSLFEWNLLNPWDPTAPGEWKFVGTANYSTIFTDDDFWNAALNALIWLVVFPAGVTVLALVVSVSIWRLGRHSAVFRTVFILPMTISLAATGVIWSFIYNSDAEVGVLNAVLSGLGADISINLGFIHFVSGNWLSDIGAIDLGFTELKLVNVTLMAPAIWSFTGFGVVTYTAGLSSLPNELVDSAKVDGCRGLQLVRYVVLPHLRKPMIIVYVVSVIFALRTFDIVYVMTRGGPGEDTMVPALLLWQYAFDFLTESKAGIASAIAVVISAVMVVVSYPYLRSMTREGTGR